MGTLAQMKARLAELEEENQALEEENSILNDRLSTVINVAAGEEDDEDEDAVDE